MTTPRNSQFQKSRIAAPTLIVCALCLLFTTSVTLAQKQPADKVVLQRKGSSSRIIRSGIIVDFTGTQLTIRSRESTNVKTYDADEIVEVRTPQTQQHKKGLVSFANGDVERAAAFFELAMIEETRDWVRRELTGSPKRFRTGQDLSRILRNWIEPRCVPDPLRPSWSNVGLGAVSRSERTIHGPRSAPGQVRWVRIRSC